MSSRRVLAVVTQRPQYRLAAATALPNGLEFQVVTVAEFYVLVSRREIWGAIVEPHLCTEEFRAKVGVIGGGRHFPIAPLAELDVLAENGWPKMRAMWAQDLRWSASAMVRTISKPGTHLGIAASRIASATAPYRSVQHLADEIECERETLGHQWAHLFGVGQVVTLGRFVETVLLLHIVGEDHNARGWKETRRRWGIGRGRGGSLSRRLVGCDYAHIVGPGFGDFANWIEEKLIVGLTRARALHAASERRNATE